MPTRSAKKLARLIALVCLLLACFSHGAAQESGNQCVQSPDLYQLANYTVKNITIRPLLKFIPGGANLQQALAAAIADQAGNSGLQVNGKFNRVKASDLESILNAELERRALVGKMGVIFARHRLINCDEQAKTLEVQYQVLTAARPSYLTTSFEVNNRKEKNAEVAGDAEKNQHNFSLMPFAGYNRSRAMFGGADFTYSTTSSAIRKVSMSASGSESSAVVEMDMTGSKAFSSGPFSYAEWKAAYRFSNIPADGFDIQDATVAARLFAATRPIGPHKLYFRAGASVEGGNRQSSLPQTEAPASTLVDSGYGALKLYVGTSLTTRRQDWKASYALQLGNNGDNLGVDYRKQIVDAAYRLRFLPSDHKPFQLDAQVTAGWLRNTNGFVPYGERFFGGNSEEEFIQGDSWRIRSNPYIRSFPQNRLNGSNPFPLGGDRFVSLNFTVAQTVWQKQLIPREIASDPDVIAALGGQLLTTRTFLREQAIQESKEMEKLEEKAGCVDDESSCLTPIVNRLKTLLTTLASEAGSNDALKKAIDLFRNGDDGDTISNLEDKVSSAKLDPNAFDKPLEDAAAVSSLQANPVEQNVTQIIVDDPGDPDDPDDDTVSLISVVEKYIKGLNDQLTAPNLAARKTELQTINSNFEQARTALRTGLNSVNLLRSYQVDQIQQAKNAFDQPSASNRKLADIAEHIKALLKPERDKVRADLAVTTITREQRNALLDYRELLDDTDTWAEKVRSAAESVQISFDAKDFSGVKFDLERMNVGFGGLISYLSGLDEGLRDLRHALNERGLGSITTQLDTDVREALTIQKRLKSAYAKLRVPKAEVKANETVTYVGQVLGVFFREANVVGISPVFMFDAARLRLSGSPQTERFRYGVGGGIRFSLVNVDFTAGYSINPNRRLNEPRGALVIRMDINDLF